MRQVPQQLNRLTFILPLFIVLAIDATGFGIITPLLAPLVTHTSQHFLTDYPGSFSRHLIYGIILAAFPLSFMVGAPILGGLSDRFGRKKILLLCLSGTLLGFVCYALSFSWSSLTLLLLGRIVAGFTSGSQGIAQAAMADVSRTSQIKAANIGVIAIAMTLGLVLGPLIAGELSNPHWVGWFSLSTPFYFVIMLTIINLFLLVLGVEESVTTKQMLNNKGQNQFSQLIAFFRKPSVFMLLLTFFLFELGWSLYYQSLGLMLVKQFHYSTEKIGLFLTYVGLTLSFGLFFIVRLVVKRIAFHYLLKVALLIGAISLLVIAFSPVQLAQYLLAVPVTFAVALTYTGLITLLSDRVDSSHQGLLMGTTDSLLALAFAITGVLAGWLAYFSVYLPFMIAGVFWLLALIKVSYGFMSRSR